MLCDDLITDYLFHSLYDGLDKVMLKIKHAHKFVLTKDFAEAADGLVENIPELQKVVPMCRLPSPLTWIEFLHDDRPHWNPEGPYEARPVDPNRHQGAPQRVGFLFQQADDAKRWEAHLFWKLRSIPIGGVADTPYNGSIVALKFDADKALNQSDPLMAAMNPVHAEFGTKLTSSLLKTRRDVAGKLFEYAMEDWGGEFRFIIAILGLLNARNVVELQRVDMEPVNRKRAKSGKRQLFTHDLIKIRPFILSRQGGIEAHGHRDVRKHFVIGHFKHRKSGLYWWNLHVRGKKGPIILRGHELEGK